MKHDIRNVVSQYVQDDELVEAITDETYDTLLRRYIIEPKQDISNLHNQSEPGIDY